jgi:hypothetical protein
MNQRAKALAERIEQGAKALADLAESMSESEWRTPIPPDGRAAGVIIHHVASVYPIEVQLAQKLGSGEPIAGVTWDVIRDMNANHAGEHGQTSKQDTLEVLRQNSKTAAETVRTFTDEQLDHAAAVSLNGDAPLTAQFFIEDHALRHSFHHLAKIRAALKR